MEPFEIQFRAAPEDIDDLNHVNNIVYLRWVQAAAVAHWQSIASPQAQQETVWVVLRHEIDYKSPALVDEFVTARTWVGMAKGLIFERHTEIVRDQEPRLLARARTLWCPVSTETGRPKRIDRKLRAQFSSETTRTEKGGACDPK